MQQALAHATGVAHAALVAGGVIALSVGLAGCGGAKSTASSSAVASQNASQVATTGASQMGESGSPGSVSSASQPGGGLTSGEASAAVASSPSSANATGRSCGSKQTSAVIGGVAKCIEAGQMCSEKHASDYGQYGFVCEQKGNAYILRRAS